LTFKQLLINFYNTEITSHSRLIIGFAVIVFALSDIALSQAIQPFTNVQYWIWFGAVFSISLAFWYVLMRQLVYGILVNRLLHSDKEFKNFEESYQNVICEAIELKQKIFGFIPFQFFISVSKRDTKWYYRIFRSLICAGLALGTSILLALLLRLNTVADLIEPIQWIVNLIMNLF